jgi:hypothetical protein
MPLITYIDKGWVDKVSSAEGVEKDILEAVVE